MSKNLGYARKFIILRQDYSTMAELNPKGHGKLELKGLRAFISLNLENAQANNYYDVLLVTSRNNYNLGKIYVEENQKGSQEFYFGVKDLEEMGFSLEMINGILIVDEDEVLLGGYFNKSDNSIENYLEILQGKRELKAIELVHEEIQTEIEEDFNEQDQLEEFDEVFDQVVEELEELEEIIELEEVEEIEEVEEVEEVDYIETIEDIIEDYTEVEAIELEQLIEEEIEEATEDQPLIWKELFQPLDEESEELVAEPSIEEIFISALEDLFQDKQSGTMDTEQEEYIEAIVEEVDYDQFQNKNKIIQKNQTTEYIMKILRYFPYIEPFKTNLKGYNWWKINTDDPNEENGFLPYFSYVTGGNHKYPIIENSITANELMRKHKHYIFGLYNFKDEVKFYVYGIPGKFISENHPQKGLTGFNTWYEDKDNGGYWLLYIDPLTGRVIYPINPMIPVD